MIYWILVLPTQFQPKMRRFSNSFSNKTISSQRLPVTKPVSKEAQSNCATFDIYEKFVAGCLPTQTPTQKFQNEFLISESHGIVDILLSFELIFQTLQTELSRFMIESARSKIPKFPEFSLLIVKIELFR